jgi:hypothetical protein
MEKEAKVKKSKIKKFLKAKRYLLKIEAKD